MNKLNFQILDENRLYSSKYYDHLFSVIPVEFQHIFIPKPQTENHLTRYSKTHSNEI